MVLGYFPTPTYTTSWRVQDKKEINVWVTYLITRRKLSFIWQKIKFTARYFKLLYFNMVEKSREALSRFQSFSNFYSFPLSFSLFLSLSHSFHAKLDHAFRKLDSFSKKFWEILFHPIVYPIFIFSFSLFFSSLFGWLSIYLFRSLDR